MLLSPNTWEFQHLIAASMGQGATAIKALLRDAKKLSQMAEVRSDVFPTLWRYYHLTNIAMVWMAHRNRWFTWVYLLKISEDYWNIPH